MTVLALTLIVGLFFVLDESAPDLISNGVLDFVTVMIFFVNILFILHGLYVAWFVVSPIYAYDKFNEEDSLAIFLHSVLVALGDWAPRGYIIHVKPVIECEHVTRMAALQSKDGGAGKPIKMSNRHQELILRLLLISP